MLKGGCICDAVRFEVSVPAMTRRPCYQTSGGNNIFLPEVVIDHELSHGLAGCIPSQMMVHGSWVDLDCVQPEHIDNQGLGIDRKVSRRPTNHILRGMVPLAKDGKTAYKRCNVAAMFQGQSSKTDKTAIRSTYLRVFELD